MNHLRKGKFVIIYDDDNREREADLIMASEFVSPESIKTMRKDGGGLIFIMVSYEIASKLELPFLTDLFLYSEKKFPALKELYPNDIPYDTKSSFSLYINHRDTFTGITDIDRSLTMNKFAKFIKRISDLNDDTAMKMFGEEFRSPGHVPICISAKNLLYERVGHTELVTSLLEMSNITPVGSGCEIMGNNGKALSKIETKKYAKEKGFIFLEGKDIIKAWKKWQR